MHGLDKVYQNKAAIYENTEGTMYFYTMDLSLQERISLDDSAGKAGTYIFCPRTKGDRTELCKELEKYLMRRNVCILWIENPEKAYSFWRCFGISDMSKGSVLSFGNYRLILKGNTKLSCREEKLCLSGDFSFVSVGKNDCGMTCAGLGESITLAAFGGESGTMRFSVKTEKGKDAFFSLHTGIRYAMPLLKGEEKAKQRGFLSKAGVMILKNGYELSLECRLTPYALFDNHRTYLEFPERTYDSTLTDRFGRGVRLYGRGKLVFEKEALYTYFDSQKKQRMAKSTYYLGIEGIFKPDCGELLLGLAGTEFAREVREVSFVPHGNAFLSGDSEELKNQGLPAATAPYMAFAGDYYSASGHFVFFEKQTDYFRFSETKAAVCEGLLAECPVMFWREAESADAAEVKQAEYFIYRRRFDCLTKAASHRSRAEKPEQERRAVTAQGLCAGISGEDNGWEWLGIAQSRTCGPDFDSSENPDIRLYHIKPQLRLMFQDRDAIFCFHSGQEFLSLCEPSEMFTIEAEGWGFLLHPRYWRESTRMIFKYTDAVSIEQYMCGDESFHEMMEKAYDGSGKVKRGYESFVSAVTDKHYQGIVLLDLKVEASHLPEETAVIMNGIDKEKLRADFAAIERSRIYEDGERGIYAGPSDISAVIAYYGDRIIGDGRQKDYDFSTTELVVVIENSAVKDFTSTSELLVNRLFDASASAETAGDGNCLVVKGSLQRSGGISSYCFTLSKRVVYRLEDSAMLSVCVEELSMHDNASQSEFCLSGSVCTVRLEACDLFGYGAQEKGLSFSGMKLIRSKINNTMNCEYTGIQWGQDKEGMRAKSLAAQYGAVLKDVIIGRQTKSPDHMGYTSINTPVRQGRLGVPWSGMIWEIGLGALGGLSSGQAVSLNLLTAWSKNPDGQGVSIYVGIKLPSVLNGGFQLQGLLNAGFQSISLLQNDKEEFFFQFHNITIKALNFEFPPGSMDIFIFAEQGKTGWYAAYTDGEEQKIERLKGESYGG